MSRCDRIAIRKNGGIGLFTNSGSFKPESRTPNPKSKPKHSDKHDQNLMKSMLMGMFKSKHNQGNLTVHKARHKS